MSGATAEQIETQDDLTPDNGAADGQPPLDNSFKTLEDEEYEAAMAELAAAEAADAEDGEGEPDPADAEAAENEQVLADDDAVKATPKAETPEDQDLDGDPNESAGLKAALLAERRQRQEAELRLARLEGRVEALSGKPVNDGEGGARAEEAGPSTEDKVKELHDQIAKLYDEYEEGDGPHESLGQVRLAEREIQAQIDELTRPAPQPVLDTQIEQNLTKLEQDYPIIKDMDAKQMEPFVAKAYQMAQEQGNPIGHGAMETMRLHTLTAQAAHNHYARYFNTAPAPAEPAKAPAAPASDGGKEPSGGLSQAAKDRAAKMEAQNQHPPDINKLGNSGEGTLSEAQVDAKLASMSEEDAIEFLEKNPGMAQRLGVSVTQ